MSKKNENYTVEQTQQMRSEYGSAETDEARKNAVSNLAQEFGKSEASIRAKLVNMGIYQKAERKSKDGSDIERKGDIVETIAGLCGVDSELFDSLEKANKSVLRVIRQTLEDSQKSATE